MASSNQSTACIAACCLQLGGKPHFRHALLWQPGTTEVAEELGCHCHHQEGWLAIDSHGVQIAYKHAACTQAVVRVR
jgi:hypothetical protein